MLGYELWLQNVQVTTCVATLTSKGYLCLNYQYVLVLNIFKSCAIVLYVCEFNLSYATCHEKLTKHKPCQLKKNLTLAAH